MNVVDINLMDEVDNSFNFLTDMPDGPICKTGWASFKNLQELVKRHPEWEINDGRGEPYFRIPFEHFSQDFSEFGSRVHVEA